MNTPVTFYHTRLTKMIREAAETAGESLADICWCYWQDMVCDPDTGKMTRGPIIGCHVDGFPLRRDPEPEFRATLTPEQQREYDEDLLENDDLWAIAYSRKYVYVKESNEHHHRFVAIPNEPYAAERFRGRIPTLGG